MDFDNTIVSYDHVFHMVAVDHGLIDPAVPASKVAIRDHMRRTGNEDAWTELQGYVYGKRMADASAFPGVVEFL
ncbi:haloacid dehalogenase-like hydrolase, partial [candidate division KSB1 bacterium]|nr:haloacid dehalogenase-like hydrolase [candidate division KSB1 bacterium]